MPSYVTPKRATAYRFYVSLVSQADIKKFQTNPTLASGDAKISKDGGALANLATLPAVTPAGSALVQVDLNSTEMTADNVAVIFQDAAGAEWCDLMINIQTTVTQVDELVRSTTPANTLDVAATGEAGLDFNNIKDATAPKTLTNITVPTVTGVTNDVGITQAGADKAWNTATRTLTSFGTLIADIWAYSTRTLTAFSTSLALSVWDVLESAIVTASSIGLKVKNNLDAAITSRAPESGGNVAAIKAKTDQLGFTVANKVDATIQLAGDFAQGAADKVWATAARALTDKAGFSLAADQSGVTIGTVNALGTQAKADVNAEVLDVLNVDTFAESAAVPAATATLIAKIKWLCTLARNKMTQDSTTQTLRNDADSATIATAAVSDNGTTFTRGKWT